MIYENTSNGFDLKYIINPNPNPNLLMGDLDTSSIDPILQLLRNLPASKKHNYKLILVFGCLGDFDSIEYAQTISKSISLLNKSGISIFSYGIGNKNSRDRFCEFTGMPTEALSVDNTPLIHNQLGLYRGLSLPIGSYLNLILMCCGVSSPGTLNEVIKGYCGNKSSSQIYTSDEVIKIPLLPDVKGSLFDLAGGEGFQRPFEKATLRLLNMIEVLSNWSDYFPYPRFLTQRGGTFLFDNSDNLIYTFKSKSLLGYAESMDNPLGFLSPYLND